MLIDIVCHFPLWLHVNLDIFQYANSFNTNPYKLIRINLDISLSFYADTKTITDVFEEDVNGLIKDGSKSHQEVRISPSFILSLLHALATENSFVTKCVTKFFLK